MASIRWSSAGPVAAQVRVPGGNWVRPASATSEVGSLACFPASASRRSSLRRRPCAQTVCEVAGGADGLLRLASAWHARVMADEVVSHAFSHGFHPQHNVRLAAYWAEALGGPARYSGSYGDETSVVRIHSGNGPHEEMDRRAIACFDQALVDAGLADDAQLRDALHDYFAWDTTTTMARYHQSAADVPDGLPIPRWSWDGLVTGTGPTPTGDVGSAGYTEHHIRSEELKRELQSAGLTVEQRKGLGGLPLAREFYCLAHHHFAAEG